MTDSVTKILKEAFLTSKSLNIEEIYEIVSLRRGQENNKALRHGTRGVVHQLKKHDFLIHTSKGNYILNENKLDQ